jgi:response regulator RpfG family c-di-GMP phosphodiesterase
MPISNSNELETLKSSFTDVLRLLSNLIEMREYSSKGFSSDIVQYCKSMAQKMGMNEEDAGHLEISALLRDIGKVSISDDHLKTPLDQLDTNNQRKVKNYPVVGEALLHEIESLSQPAKFIRNIKENFDGNGFPDGLAGKDIPLGSRILSVINDYYALQDGNLIIGEIFSAAKALDYLDQHSGSLYDPEVISAFKDTLGHGGSARDAIQEEENIVQNHLVAATDLENGMTLDQDIVTSMGVILLNKGKTLRKFTIMHLQNLEKTLSENFKIHIKNN